MQTSPNLLLLSVMKVKMFVALYCLTVCDRVD